MEKEEQKKIGFKDLNTQLKILYIFGFIQLIWTTLVIISIAIQQ